MKIYWMILMCWSWQSHTRQQLSEAIVNVALGLLPGPLSWLAIIDPPPERLGRTARRISIVFFFWFSNKERFRLKTGGKTPSWSISISFLARFLLSQSRFRISRKILKRAGQTEKYELDAGQVGLQCPACSNNDGRLACHVACRESTRETLQGRFLIKDIISTNVQWK